ncbi:cadherin-like domain-containing protein [Shewanella sp. 10N.286.52.C2]|uniref:cadherin-like domain-containing protein n=1 Tax=Shewanella sp. 10N.286.52.C2 TaxID=1880838 RepID=UPI001A7E0997|nr:cadherin-like domain-containing protein [Shewanella sp. 10N.286.52.C2]
MTHTGATTNLAAVNDNPDVLPITDSVKEDASHHHTVDLLLGASDKEGDTLSINQLSYSIDGSPNSAQLPPGISLDKDGHTIIVDATNAAYQHLANGASQTITIAYQVIDGQGGHTQQTADLTIQGTDDKATLVSNVIQLTETQALDSEFQSYRGQLQLIDPDSGDNTQFVFSGKYLGQGFAPGHLDVWPNGTYQFKLDAGTNRHADELIGSLHAGESMELPYEVETSDGQKLTIMVKVTGEDNQAKIEVTPYSSLNNHVYEDHTSFGNTTNQLSSGGTLHVIDPDHDQAGFIAQTITTAEGGRFNINAQGQWSYDIDNDKVQHLGAGESFQQTFIVESIDGSAKKDITVTVHGTNDAPIASAEVRLANGLEDSEIVLTTSQLLANTSDVDDNDIGKLSIENLHADHGTIVLNADGTFTFTPEKDYNGQVHFTYDVKDGHGGVTHTGATTSLSAVRDAAIITEVTSQNITEDGSHNTQNQGVITELANGQLHVVDPDSGENSFQFSQFGETRIHDPFNGHLRINSAGNWGYSVDNANLQSLGEGQTEVVTYRVQSKDGTPFDLNINVVGTNDAPIVSSEVTLTSGTEDTSVTLHKAELLAHATDVDSGETALLSIHGLVAVKSDGSSAGTITDNADGTFTFNPEANYNGSVTFNYEVQDPHAASTSTMATMSLAAVVDESIITGMDTASVKEDVNVSNNAQVHDLIASGSLSVNDPDGGQNYFLFSQFGEQAVSDPYNGMLHLDASGNWQYAVENFQLQELSEGQVEHAIYKVQSADGTYHNIDITITGTNDAPVVSSTVILVDGTEDTAVTLHAADLLAHATDVDTGETAQLSVHSLVAVKPDGSSAGAITDNHDGTFTFNPEANYNGTVDFNYAVQDTHGGTVNTTALLSLASVADVATFGGDSTGTTIDDDTAVSGLLTVTDPDAGEDEFKVQTDVDGSYGKFSITANGHWNYTPDNRADGIASGQSPQEIFTVESADGNTQTVTVTITGSNDAPIVTAANASRSVDLGATEEDTPKTFTEAELLQLVDASDIDGDTLHIADISSTHGNFSKDAQSGEWTFTPEQHYHGIYIPVSLMVSDGSAETIAHGTIDVNKLYPAPFITGTSTGDITEDSGLNTAGELQVSGQLLVTDVDPNQSAVLLSFVAQQAVTGSNGFGSFSIDATGHWLYTADNSNPNIQGLKSGETVTDSIDVTSSTGDSQTITVTITGTNDAPTVTSMLGQEASLGTTAEDTPISFTETQLLNLVGATDIDSTDTLHVGDVSIDPAQGAFAKQPDGSWTFTPSADYSGSQLPLTIQVNDGSATTTAHASINVSGVADAPSISVSLGAVPLTSHTDSSTQILDTVEATMGASQRADPQNAMKDDFMLSKVALVSAAGLDPKLITGINVDGKDYSVNPKYVPTFCGQGVEFPTLDYDTYQHAQHISLTFASGAPKSMDWQFVAGMGDDFTAAGIAELISRSCGVTLHVDREISTGSGSTYQTGDVTEDSVVDLHITITSPDSSEDLSVSISGLPSGSILSAGTDNHDGTWTLQQAELSGLTLTPPLDYSGQLNLTVTAISTDGTDIATTDSDLRINITPVAETSTLTGSDISMDEVSGTVALGITLNIHADASETQSLLIEGVPASASLSAGTKNTDGSWTLTPAQLQGLTVTPEAQWSGTMALHISATSTEQTGEQSVSTTNLNVQVNPLVDMVVTSHDVHVAPTDMLAGIAVPIGVNSLDTSETFQFSVTIPSGWHIKDSSGTWDSDDSHLTYNGNQINTIKVIAPDGFKGSANIEVHVTGFDGSASHDFGITTSTVTVDNTTPAVTATAALPVDLGATAEDTAISFSEADLLQLVGATDINHDSLTITDVDIDAASGAFVKQADGSWLFSPAANYSGDDLAVSVKVSDGTEETTAHGTLDITSVTDSAAPQLVVSAEQQVMGFAANSASGVVNTDPISAGGAMHALTIDMTILGGAQVASSGIHGATLISYGTPSDPNHMYIWNNVAGKDLTFRVGGTEYTTGIPLATDGLDHRYTFSWDGQQGTFDVLIDGQPVKHMDDVGKGAVIDDGGKFALGNDQDSFGGGFSTGDAFTGKMFNVAIAKDALPIAELEQAPLSNLLHGDARLLTDIRMENGNFQDATGNFHYQTVGSVTSQTVEVDTAIASPNPGATLKLAITAGAPADQSDHVTGVSIQGLIVGSVLTDGHSHSHTVTSATESIDLQGWDQTHLSAKLPAGSTDNMRIMTMVETTGPDGAIQIASSDSTVILDPTKPIPDAIITGDDMSKPLAITGISSDSDHDFITSDNRLIFHGTGIPGHDVNLVLDSTIIGIATVDAKGNWEIDNTAHELPEHALNIKLVSMDANGSPEIQTQIVTIDSTAATLQSGGSSDEPDLTDDTSFTVQVSTDELEVSSDLPMVNHAPDSASELAHEPVTSATPSLSDISGSPQADVAPVDYYLNMVGLSNDDIAVQDTPSGSHDQLATFVSGNMSDNADPLVDDMTPDAFENPLDDDNHQQHKDELLADLNDQPDQSDTNQANDDDLLHQALNDMHNQV